MHDELSNLIFNSISDGVFTVDQNCIITSFNHAAERITGFTARQAIGKHCFDVFRTEICHKQCALKDTLKTRDPVEDARVTIITKDGHEVPIHVTTTLLRDNDDNVVGAVEFFRDVTEVEHLRERLGQRNTLSDIVSVTPKMQELISLLPDVATSECNVLIQGPSGSGKELVAEVTHNLSPRRYGPYVKINCAALPASLLESELFGYEKGAFTDAKRDKQGLFGLANGGTLLLDEISEMAAELQVKLLRVLNNGEYRPLGSSKTLVTDARILAATNADLQTAIAKGTFREDLFYRINVVSLDIPPLCERPADIALLVSHFVKVFCKKTRKRILGLSPEALAVLRKYSFPGNVRELENAIEHAFIMCHGQEIQQEHLPPQIIHHSALAGGISSNRNTEKDIILEALRRHKGNRVKAAEELGVHRSTLWRKIRSYNIQV